MSNNRSNRTEQSQHVRMTREERAQYETYIRAKRADEERRAARIKARKKAARKKQRIENARIFSGRLLVFVIVLALLLLLTGALLLIHFHRTPDSPANVGELTYIYGGKEIRTAQMPDNVEYGGIYLCFNDLSDYIGMAESGDAREMKFILVDSAQTAGSAAGNGDEEYVVFYSDTEKATINGQDVSLEIPNVIRGDEVWVSTSFVEKYMNGLSVVYSSKKSTVTVARIRDDERSTDKETVFADVSFRLKSAPPANPLEEDPLIGEIVFSEDGTYDLSFLTDMTEYEPYMNPEGNMRDAFLDLVNGDNPLSDADEPNDLVDVKYTSTGKQTQKMRLYAYKALEALFNELHAEGYYNMAVYVGYTSYGHQKTQFEQYVSNEMAADPSLTEKQAQNVVLTYYSLPGTSEHQTGLCVDMDTMGAYTTDFMYTEEYGWLAENAWKFGFILRYPSGKENVTGNSFEPWHFRYVGRHHALKMHESGLCLEEYLKQIKK